MLWPKATIEAFPVMGGKNYIVLPFTHINGYMIVD
jgi:hypothetical protein